MGTVNGRTITMLGDLMNRRKVHSLISVLSLYSVTLNLVSPSGLDMPSSVVNAVHRTGIRFALETTWEEFLAETDVLYVTHVQKGRFASEENG